MQSTISAMVEGRRRWLERMRRAKAAGIIDKIPTGRRRPQMRAASSKIIGRARSAAFRVIEVYPQTDHAKRPEEMTKRELMDEICRIGLCIMLDTLSQPASDNRELARLQIWTARQLLGPYLQAVSKNR